MTQRPHAITEMSSEDLRHLARTLNSEIEMFVASGEPATDAQMARVATANLATEELVARGDGVPAPAETPVAPTATCIEHAYGTTTRLSFQINVF